MGDTVETFREFIGKRDRELRKELSGSTNLINNNLDNVFNGFNEILDPNSYNKESQYDKNPANQPKNPTDALIKEAEARQQTEIEKEAELAKKRQNQLIQNAFLEKQAKNPYRKGGTILTSPLGIPDTAPTQGKTLLGM